MEINSISFNQNRILLSFIGTKKKKNAVHMDAIGFFSDPKTPYKQTIPQWFLALGFILQNKQTNFNELRRKER